MPMSPDLFLDITGDSCPMTFVRARLQLDRMASGEVLELRFRGEEPRRNLSRSLSDQGYAVLAAEDLPDGEGRLLVRKP
jgi:tRNA 2-thiouridine synthesizing protein A